MRELMRRVFKLSIPIAVSMVAGRVRKTGFGPWARRSSGMADHSKIAL
jgi:hypothetical protein